MSLFFHLTLLLMLRVQSCILTKLPNDDAGVSGTTGLPLHGLSSRKVTDPLHSISYMSEPFHSGTGQHQPVLPAFAAHNGTPPSTQTWGIEKDNKPTSSSSRLSTTGYKYVYCSPKTLNGPRKWHTIVRWREHGRECKIAVWSCLSLEQALIVHDAIVLYHQIHGINDGETTLRI